MSNASVTKLNQVAGSLIGAGFVIDTNPGNARWLFLVIDHHHRQTMLEVLDKVMRQCTREDSQQTGSEAQGQNAIKHIGMAALDIGEVDAVEDDFIGGVLDI